MRLKMYDAFRFAYLCLKFFLRYPFVNNNTRDNLHLQRKNFCLKPTFVIQTQCHHKQKFIKVNQLENGFLQDKDALATEDFYLCNV